MAAFLSVNKKEIILLTDLVVQSSNIYGHLFLCLYGHTRKESIGKYSQ